MCSELLQQFEGLVDWFGASCLDLLGQVYLIHGF